MSRRIQFLSFDGCPLAVSALAELEAALVRLGPAHGFRLEHVNLMADDTPDRLRNWGSPTILVDGEELTGKPPGDANACRLYSSPGGVPGADEIVNVLECSTKWGDD